MASCRVRRGSLSGGYVFGYNHIAAQQQSRPRWAPKSAPGTHDEKHPIGCAVKCITPKPPTKTQVANKRQMLDAPKNTVIHTYEFSFCVCCCSLAMLSSAAQTYSTTRAALARERCVVVAQFAGENRGAAEEPGRALSGGRGGGGVKKSGWRGLSAYLHGPQTMGTTVWGDQVIVTVVSTRACLN